MEGGQEEGMMEIKRKLKGMKIIKREGKSDEEDAKRQEAYNMSPRAGGGPSNVMMMGKSSSGRFNCLCAPTTHPGSFRCRYHRRRGNSTRLPRGVSVPTNLSMIMASSKSGGIVESSNE